MTWVNNEVVPHTVVDLNKGFRSKILVKDAKFSFTFPTAGDYSYLCSKHPNMKGKVIVKAAVGIHCESKRTSAQVVPVRPARNRPLLID